MDKCFACNNKRASHAAVTSDGQLVFVGSECIKKIRAAGTVGYQPPLGGPVLFLVENAPDSVVVVEIRAALFAMKQRRLTAAKATP